MMNKFICILAMISFLTISFAAKVVQPTGADSVIQKHQGASKLLSSPDQAIMLTRKKPEFTIRLSSNPGSTGFSWFVTEMSDAIKIISHNYLPAKNGLIGSPGYETWTFKARYNAFIAPQRLYVNLIYVRPWEISGGRKITFVISTSD